MTDIRICDLVKRTGFGARYWQRRVAAGEVPGGEIRSSREPSHLRP